MNEEHIKSPFLEPPPSQLSLLEQTVGEANGSKILELLHEAVEYEKKTFENDEDDVSGSDLVEFFAAWRVRVEKLIGQNPKKKPKKRKAPKEPMFLNKYKCTKCKWMWAENWPATCDSQCPNCNESNISPYESEDA